MSHTRLTIVLSDKYLSILAKIGYIMVISQYDRLEEDRQWMNDYGCIRIVEENDENERNRPLWKQLMVALQRGDELVISKFSNAIRGSRELATLLEFCRVKVIRIVSIHDRIDSKNELFPDTKPSDVLEMMGALPEEVLALRKSAEHVVNLQEKMIVSLPPVSSAKLQKYNRQNEKCNFEKRKVHFLVFSGHFGRVCLTAVQSSLKRCLIG